MILDASILYTISSKQILCKLNYRDVYPCTVTSTSTNMHVSNTDPTETCGNSERESFHMTLQFSASQYFHIFPCLVWFQLTSSGTQNTPCAFSLPVGLDSCSLSLRPFEPRHLYDSTSNNSVDAKVTKGSVTRIDQTHQDVAKPTRFQGISLNMIIHNLTRTLFSKQACKKKNMWFFSTVRILVFEL